ncbi:hypothetical protein [Nocardioides campestrisoli]|uniref:hypothetical protein n=1 Tax=Nocardioides campestrisoli TaxID=2736757 RepID=UPI0015E65668|nr:hypothetical protein [Nocardioides campestrisoli]
MDVIAVRRERVILEAQDGLSPALMKSALAAKALNHELNSLSGTSVRTSRSSAAVASDIDRIGSSAQRADRSINQLTGRLRLLADLTAILGPTLAPLAGVLAAGVGGLANQLGAAAAAGGVAIAAFQGVGDALKAANDYAIDPSDANLDKLRETFAQISPVAREFVFTLRDLGPALRELRDIGAEGLLPGVTASLDALEARIPDLARIMESVSTTLGDIAADSGESLASDRWDEFFSFIATDTPQTLQDLASIVGDLTHGLGELWMAFDPLNTDFSTWMVGVADGFDQWAAGLAQTDGFAEFVEYVRSTGPQVADTLGALGDAFLQIAEASSPLGGPILAGLEAVFDVIGSIADSDLGTPIMAGVAALALFNRTMATTRALAGTQAAGFLGKGFAGSRTAIQGVRADVETLASTWATAGARTVREQERISAATRSLKSNLGAVAKDAGRAGLGLGGLALASTGAADGIGVTNSVSLGLIGSLAGPWGAAVGGGVGLLMDFGNAGDLASESQRTLSRTVADAGADFWALDAALEAGRAKLASYSDEQSFLGKVWEGWDWALTGESAINSLADGQAAAEERAKTLKTAFATLAVQMGETFTDAAGRNMVPTLDELTTVATTAAPALAALGITVEDLAGMDHAQLVATGQEIAAWNTHSDSAEGRIEALAGAMVDLDSGAVSTEMSVSALAEAIQALLAPGMNLSATTDAWRSGLRNLNDELAESGRSLTAQTDAADQNRAAIRDQVTNLTNLMVAQADAGGGARKLSRMMFEGRDAIVAAGRAAGLSEREVRDYLKTLGLTPKQIRTVVNAAVDNAKNDVDDFGKKADQATKPRNARVDAQTGGARDQLEGIIAQLNRIDGMSASARVVVTNQTNYVTNRRTVGAPVFEADGGVLDFFADGGFRENHVAQIAPAGSWRVWAEPETGGEAYIPLAPEKRDRSIEIWEEVGARLGVTFERFANGSPGKGSTPAGGLSGAALQSRMEIVRLEKQIKDLVRELARDGKNRLRGKGKEIAELELRAARESLAAAKAQAGIDREITAMEKRSAALEERSEREQVASERLREALDLNKESLDRVTSKMDEVGQASVAGFNSDLWSGDMWAAGAGDPFAAVLADIAGLDQRDRLQDQLAGLGITGDALATLLSQAEGPEGNARLAALIESGRAGELQGLLNLRADRRASVALEAGRYAHGAEQDAAAAEVRVLQTKYDQGLLVTERMVAQLELITRQLAAAPEATGTAVALPLKTSARNAQGRARRNQPRRPS